MLLAFFDSKGLVYTHIMPKVTTINANYILVVLSKLMVHLRKKRLEMTKGAGSSIGTTLPSTLSPLSKLAGRLGDPAASPSPPTCLTWHQWTSSCFGKRKNSLLASTWPRRTSRARGKGWHAPLPKTSMPPRSGGSTSAGSSAFRSTANMSRKVEK